MTAYTLKRSARARRVRLEILPDASVVVTAPKRFAAAAIEKFVAKHERWIETHVKKLSGREVLKIKRGKIPALKRRAAAIAAARCSHFAKIFGIHYKKITIRAQRSRWGSASTSGTLCFNYKIALLRSELSDYIIIHEICHLLEMNHSARFWAHVARECRNYKKLRRELRNITSMHL